MSKLRFKHDSKLLDRMKEQLLKLGQVNWTGRISKSGGSRIPSVTQYLVKVSPYNAILEQIGIKLRLPHEAEFIPHKANSNMNKYMEYQIKRIRKLRDRKQFKKMGKVIYLQLRYSVCFRLSAMQHVIPQGYFSIASNQIFAINRKVTKILKNGDGNIKYKRTYIDKVKPDGSKTFRPLGVPSIEGRLVLHMGNNMLHLALENYFLESQHGFIPGRGTNTAGRELLEKIHKYDYVFECDLKQFFPSCDIRVISQILEGNGVPRKVWEYLEKINMVGPKLRPKDLLDERKYRAREELDHMNEFSITSLRYHDYIYEDAQLYKGIAQGAPTSPLLSITILKDFLSRQIDEKGELVESISYADDPIFFGHNRFVIKENKYDGIELNLEKSGGVKYNGEWKKDLKYLGLKLINNGTNLIAATRNGAIGEIPDAFKDLGIELEASEENAEATQTSGQLNARGLVKIAKRNIFGFIQSCLYNNDGTNDNSLEYQMRGILNTLAKIHKKAFVTRLPKNTDSTLAIYKISSAIRSTFR